jgi:gliding motility-associated-like protein
MRIIYLQLSHTILSKKFKPIIKWLLIFVFAAGFSFRSSAQAPTISYSSPQIYTEGKPIANLVPASSGVANPGYGNSVSYIGSGFGQPVGVAVDAAGNVYVADQNNSAVYEILLGGGSQVMIGSGFKSPEGVAVDAAGNVYVADVDTSVIIMVPAGGGNQVALGSGFSLTSGVAVDMAGNIYVADFGNNAIKKIPVGGGTPVTLGSGFNQPTGVAVDAAGNVYVADYGNNEVKKIPVGNGTPIILGSGFTQPVGLSVDFAGNVYVADQNDNAIKEIPIGGGTPISIGSGFNFPTGVALDGLGDVYVADAGNSTVDEIKPVGGYYINKSLPVGLSFDPATGIISGTPTVPSPATNYAITAYNNTGSSTAIVNIEVISTNAALSDLSISSGILTPVFAGATTAYTASVPNSASNVTVTPTTSDATATVTVNGTAVISGAASGPISLTVGSNTITTVVTAQDGVTKETYTLIVTRAPSSNAALSNLRISSGVLTPVFASGTINYTASVPNAVLNITVTPATSDATATVTVNGNAIISGSASGTIPLAVGPNTITTVVTAQDGVTKETYTIIITRAPSSNAVLGNLSISSGTLNPVFASATNSYTANLPNSVSGITLTPVTSDPTATVTVNGIAVLSGSASGLIPLTAGPNIITTIVTAQDGTTRETYTVTVTRAPSTNAALSNLSISSGTLSPVFAGGTTSYTASVPNSASNITVTPTTGDATATVTVNGKAVKSGTASGLISLTVGSNTILTVVTAQDGVTKETYTIIITRAPSSNAALSNLSISSGVLTPVFAGATTYYTASVLNSVSTLTATPTTSDATATITVNGTAVKSGTASGQISLTVGPNTITTVVSAQDGFTKETYTVIITRAPSSNAVLSNLSVSSGTLNPVFASTTNIYTVNLPNSVSGITLTPATSDPTATVTVNGIAVLSGSASGLIPLTAGPNIITTIVTAQDGTTKETYKVTVTRAPSTNAALSNLSISSGPLSPVFAGGTINYTVNIYTYIPNVNVTPVTSDATASVTINGVTVKSGSASVPIPLAIGANKIIIIVTAQDGITQMIYTINITRFKADQTITFGALTSVDYGTPDFSPGATVTSGLLINYSSDNSLVATIVNNEIHLTGVGSANITASVAGDADYNPAAPVTQTLLVNKGQQVINLEKIPILAIGSQFDLGGITASSGLPVSFAISDTTIAILKGDTLNAVDLGIAVLTVSQPGNADYSAAPDLEETITVEDASGDEILIHKAVSPNGDGINDFFYIEGIKDYPDNSVLIVNPNGVKIFYTNNYDNKSHVFDGHSNVTGALQPAGTYFYLVVYTAGGKKKIKRGYLELKYE